MRNKGGYVHSQYINAKFVVLFGDPHQGSAPGPRIGTSVSMTPSFCPQSRLNDFSFLATRHRERVMCTHTPLLGDNILIQSVGPTESKRYENNSNRLKCDSIMIKNQLPHHTRIMNESIGYCTP